jgi:ATP-binding cassette subfamily B protein
MKKFNSLLTLIPYFRPYRREVFLAFLALLITAITVLFFGKTLKYLIDLGLAKKDHFSLNLVLFIFIAAVILMATAGYYRSYLINSAAEKVISDLRKKIYNHIIAVSAEYFEITKTGDVISRLTTDTTLLYSILSSTISFLLRNSLLFIGGLIFLFFTSAKLSIVAITLILIAISPIFLIGRKVKKLSNTSQAAVAAVGSQIEESLNGIKTVQANVAEARESEKFSKFVDQALTSSIEKIRVKSQMIAFVIALAFGSVAVVLWVGGNDVLAGKITSGDLSSFIFYSIVCATSLAGLSHIAGQLQNASSAAERIFALLEIKSPVAEAENLLPFEFSDKIDIKFNLVNFAYPSRLNSLIINNLSLDIKFGEKLAIVGSSGSGKSTIFQLLMRFYDVSRGAITLNGRDIKTISLHDLRQNFSYVTQDCFIFSGTIFENIAYADKSIAEADVEKLINQNPALEFINQMPQKIHSLVGEKGIKLSGGERQRIAFARALVKNSPILLLDEATSALDNHNEILINRSIHDFGKDKTVIIVAHRLSSVINAERIIFLEDGKIKESGNHHELMSLNGLYAKMYELELNSEPK